MLVLSRETSQRVAIVAGGETIWVTILDVDRGRVRLGFEASRAVKFHREELLPYAERHYRTRERIAAPPKLIETAWGGIPAETPADAPPR